MSAEAFTLRGLPAIRWRTPDGAAAVATLQGAHLASWTLPGGGEMLFVSERSAFEAGRAIRGGVPVCFPQFADRGPLAQHGFARTQSWRFMSAEEHEGRCTATFALEDSPATRALWPHAFRVELAATIGGPRLAMALRVTNRGDAAFEFTAALHTYFRVANSAAASIEGLRGARFLTRGAPAAEVELRGRVTAREPIDRIYFAPSSPLRMIDRDRALDIAQSGFTDTVVWNPGPAKAAAMADLGADAARQMLCVEAAAVEPAVRLAAGATWEGQQVVDFLAPGAGSASMR